MENQKKKFTVRRIALAAGIAATFFVGVGLGSAGNAVPTVETVEVEKEVKVNVPVEVTPKACEDALNNADLVNMITDQGFTAAGDAMISAANMDVDGMSKAYSTLEELDPQLESARAVFEEAAKECRSKKS